MQKSVPIFIAIVLLLLISSCAIIKAKQEPMDGVYKSLGYGRIVKIEKGEFIVADVTSKSCIPLMEGETAALGEALQYKNDTLSLVQGINKYYFVRIADAPAICKAGSPEYVAAEAKKNDPVYNFETLWETFTDHYAYFELRNVDPEKMYAAYRPKISSEMSQPQFFHVVYEMLESFEDGHIDISAPDEIQEAAMLLHLKEHPDKMEDTSDVEEPAVRLRNYQVSKQVADRYIPKGTFIKNGNLRWGILKDNIGYLQLNQMMAVADYNLSDTLSYRDYWMAFLALAEESANDNKDELDGINSSLDIVMNELAKTDAMIIDVRFNGGGKDEVGMAVLQRFNDVERKVFSKKGKMGDGFTPDNIVLQAASADAYVKPLYLLIGPESASATEIMALSSLSMPNITRIGSRTEGVFSDILDKTLPNGCVFGLSSEVYLDLKGTNYESIGIPADVEIGYERDTQKFLSKVVDGLDTEGDEAIEKAIQLIGQN